MAVTLNVKSPKNITELLNLGYVGEMLDYLMSGTVYYQMHCFDIVIPIDKTVKDTKEYCIRIHTGLTGALMAGSIGKTPLMDLTKGTKYLLSGAAVHLQHVENLNVNVEATKITGSIGYSLSGLYSNYAEFLKEIGDEKATPNKYKTEKDPKDGTEFKLDFNALGKKKTLAAATQLGQPVMGTDKSSTYKVCGTSQMLNMAYRYNPTAQRISMRVEPRKNITLASDSSMWDSCLACGMSKRNKAGGKFHYSMHVLVKDKVEAIRVLGATLATLQLFEPSNTSFKIEVT